MTLQEKIEFLAGEIWSARTWLEQHGRHSKKPRPDFNIAQYEKSLQGLEAIQSDYLQAQQRRAG